MTNAERQKRWRARQAMGLRIVHLEVDEVATWELLSRAGFLDEDAKPEELEAALQRLISSLSPSMLYPKQK